MTLVLAAGTTQTAAIEGLSAAGATAELRTHTPSMDAEILCGGQPAQGDVVPVSPSGCPTPAVATRAVRELEPFPVTVLDAGLAVPTGVETVDIGANPGEDIREPIAVPDAAGIAARARNFAASHAGDGPVAIAETIPGGTTTAMGVLRALGEPAVVSSSLAENPLEQKRGVVDRGLEASGLKPGEAAGNPFQAIRAMGDPVQAALLGYARGALEHGARLTLAGGTQLLTVAACLRHVDISAELELATTIFLSRDQGAEIDRLGQRNSVSISATDPGFDTLDHRAAAAYHRGEAKEGVGMGWALRHLDRSETPMAAFRHRFLALTDELLAMQAEGDAT